MTTGNNYMTGFNKFGGGSVTSAAKAAGDTIGEITTDGILGNIADSMIKDRTVVSRDDLRYPLDLASNTARPQIRFTCFEREDIKKGGEKLFNLVRRSTYFPCPPNIAFADNASLSTIDLGMFGAGLSDTLNRTEGNKDKGVASLGGNFTKSGTIVQALGSLGIAGAKLAGAEGLVDKVTFANRIVANPFQNTAFQGSGIRSFTFNFKMIAESQSEADEIRHIHHRFRRYMYAGRLNQGKSDAAGFLQYPAIWEIEFLTGINSKGVTTNKFLPGIMACYLQNFNSTFNTTAAAWHPDGAPLEVDISMTFQEARALERTDIDNLHNMIEKYSTEGADDDDMMNARGISNKGTSRATALNYGEGFTETNQSEGGNTFGRGLGSDADLRTAGQKRADARNNSGNRYRESQRIL